MHDVGPACLVTVLSSQVVGCLCPKGFSGKFCGKPTNACRGEPCFRGVRCRSESEPGRFSCGECPDNTVTEGKQGYKCFEHGGQHAPDCGVHTNPDPTHCESSHSVLFLLSQTCAGHRSPSPATKMPSAAAQNKTTPAHVSLVLQETGTTAQVPTPSAWT